LARKKLCTPCGKSAGGLDVPVGPNSPDLATKANLIYQSMFNRVYFSWPGADSYAMLEISVKAGGFIRINMKTLTHQDQISCI